LVAAADTAIILAAMHADPIEPTANSQDRAGVRVDGVTRRLVYSLALVPIVPASSIAASALFENALTPLGFDDLRSFQLFYSTLVVVAVILIWRKFVLWTMGRRWLTAIVSLIPFVQVAVNLPLWQIQPQGCIDFSEEALRIGQHQVGTGVWGWLLIWIWWGVEKHNMSNTAQRTLRRLQVPLSAKCLAAVIGSIPMVFGITMIFGELADEIIPLTPTGMKSAWTDAVTVAALLIAGLAAWTWAWRPAVVWSSAVRKRTLLAWMLLVALPPTAHFLLAAASLNTLQGLASCAAALGWGVWMVWTIRTWPMKPEAVALDPMAPRCLKCSYSLRGLTTTRCPECGDEPTLDELWAAPA
jgi:hypothetical protein